MRVVVTDTETSGLAPPEAGVVELGGVAYEYDEALNVLSYVNHFTTLVDPGHPIPPDASAIHHLVDSHLVGAPSLDDAVASYVETLSPDCVIAHNAAFDKKFLPHLHNLPWGCTLKAARKFLNADKNSNQYLRYAFKLDPEFAPGTETYAHRALYDCFVTGAILKLILTKTTLKSIMEIAELPSLLKTVSFGKEAGKLWRDVDKSYLRWILDANAKKPFDPDVVYTARYYYEKK